jgi:hypothetical protein
MLGSIFTIFINYNNFKTVYRYDDADKTPLLNNNYKDRGYYNNHEEDTITNYINFPLLFILGNVIFIVSPSIAFFVLSILKIPDVNGIFYFFNAERYVNYKYPGKYWSVLPPCKFDSGEKDKGHLIEDPNSTMNCSDFKKMRMRTKERKKTTRRTNYF